MVNHGLTICFGKQSTSTLDQFMMIRSENVITATSSLHCHSGLLQHSNQQISYSFRIIQHVAQTAIQISTNLMQVLRWMFLLKF